MKEKRFAEPQKYVFPDSPTLLMVERNVCQNQRKRLVTLAEKTVERTASLRAHYSCSRCCWLGDGLSADTVRVLPMTFSRDRIDSKKRAKSWVRSNLQVFCAKSYP